MPTIEFKGKGIVYAHHLSVPYRTLEVDHKKSLLPKGRRKGGESKDDNMIIHGDNLEALKALLPRYAGRVDCIYIDPPYNTGNEGWCYNDNVNSPLMKAWRGKNGEKDRAVDREDEERHDKWLCMMWPRLQLLRELLAETGAIFISIDDNEVHRLRAIMDEIFGERNFVATIIWRKKYAPANDAKYFSDNHDFVVCYAKNKKINGENDMPCWQRNLLPRSDKQDKAYRYDDGDGKGPWRSGDLTAKTYSPEYDYPIVNPNTREEFTPTQGRSWCTSKKNMVQWIAEGRVFFGKSGKGRPQLKRYLSEVKGGVVPTTVWDYDEVGHTDGARKMLKEIFSDKKLPFDNPKPVGLAKRVCQVAGGRDAVILDSFAGSGTTAQAVLALNKEDGGDRRFILVECESYANSLTAERVRRVIKGVKSARDDDLKKGLGGRFQFCTLGPDISLERMLRCKGLPSYEQLARHVVYVATGESLGSIKNGKDHFFGENDNYRFHMIYRPEKKFLRSGDASLDFETAEKIAAAAKKRGKKALVFAPAKYMSQADLLRLRVVFCHLPYSVLYRPFGQFGTQA